MSDSNGSVGEALRQWRERRRLSRNHVAADSKIAIQDLAMIEADRIAPTRDVVLRLGAALDLPLRDRNAALTACGFAPAYPERRLDDPVLGHARHCIDVLLARHDPFPALAIDRRWTVHAGNAAFCLLTADVDPLLLRPPVNLLRLFLHPAGLAPRVATLHAWHAHVTQRVRRQIERTEDAALQILLDEIQSYPLPPSAAAPSNGQDAPYVPFRLVTIDGTLSFFGTSTAFSAAQDITLADLRIEAFHPADEDTARLMRRMAEDSARAKKRWTP